ncbi:MAG: hypothetical protein ACRD30_02415 [Bryobacteraceae bacterium]
MDLTRRTLARMLAVAAVPVAAAAQNDSDPELTLAREHLRDNAAALAGVPLAMTIEPACHFKA